MTTKNEKIEKLIGIAKAYYEEDKTQSEVAKIFGVSRPLISRMLKEAKDLGIVKIEVRSPKERTNALCESLHHAFAIRGGKIVSAGENVNITNAAIAEAAIDLIKTLHPSHLGIGWGTIVGILASQMDSQPPLAGFAKTICPLIGNSNVSNRNYHSNEIVRIFAQQSAAKALYWHAPAFVESASEAQQLMELENYRTISTAWKELDTAVVNIGNYPSVPDLATRARYQDKLSECQAVGRILSYYLDINGEIIRSDSDFTLQIPIDILRHCQNVVGVCAGNVTPSALVGALRSGIITHIIASDELTNETLKLVV